MRPQRNMFQMKEQDKTSKEELGEKEINNLSDKKFQVMMVKIV